MNLEDHPLGALCENWRSKIDLAVKHKKTPFQDTADQCMEFFSGTAGFMWKDTYKFKLWKGNFAPKFKITLAKAFELVAIFGPVLYSRNPVRTVTPRDPLPISPDLFSQDPMGQMQFQMLAERQRIRSAEDSTRAEVMQRWLNYTPNEAPNGGLKHQSEQAITEALIKGRGCLWTELYQFPASDMVIPVSSYDTVDGLLIDPDAESLDDAKWIARRQTLPIWQVEREFQLPEGSLKGKGDLESSESQARDDLKKKGERDRKKGESFDLMTIWRIYTKCGVGARLAGMQNDDLAKTMDEVVGDYAHLVIARNVEYPLNFPKQTYRKANDDEVQKAFSWPIPFWTDERWPVTCLDFYKVPRRIWPLAPLAPGLAELTFLNIVISHLASRIWTSSRDFIAVAKSAAQELSKKLEEGQDQSILEISQTHGDIRKVIQWLQQPQTNFDVWKIVEAVTELFERRTGLTDLAYGLNPDGKMLRTAEDAQNRRSQMSIRPDYMAGKVEEWQTEVARKEAFCSRWFVEGRDIRPALGEEAGLFWDRLVVEQDVNLVTRELEYRVEAGSARKPNKDRDIANANDAMQKLLPVYDNHANATGDTGPVNEVIGAFGKAIDMKLPPMGTRAPPPPDPNAPPPPEVIKAQAEVQKVQAETQLKQMELQSKPIETQQKLEADRAKLEMDRAAKEFQMMIDARMKQQEMQHKRELAEMELRMKALEKQLEMRQDAQKHQQEMAQDQQVHQQEMVQSRVQAAIQAHSATQQAEIQREQGEQQLKQSKAEGELKTKQAKQQGELKTKQAKQQMSIQKQQAKQKPKPKGKKDGK